MNPIKIIWSETRISKWRASVDYELGRLGFSLAPENPGDPLIEFEGNTVYFQYGNECKRLLLTQVIERLGNVKKDKYSGSQLMEFLK